MDGLSHASFFSGVGGLDLGLARAGFRTVSFSEIDAYASAVLAERWPGIPNLGDIVKIAQAALADGRGIGQSAVGSSVRLGRSEPDAATPVERHGSRPGGTDWRDANLWTGGFPCQDLSVAGKRRGMVEGTRSNLAYAFLALVERHRPPAILLENVPGLLSSHGGRDMAALLGAMVELGYGVAYRILDARHFGVPQRRRRVFILGLRSNPNDPTGRVAAERAAAVLSVGARCERHPPAGVEAGPDAAAGVAVGALRVDGRADGAGSSYDNTPRIGPQIDADRMRGADGLAGRLDDRGGLAATLNSGGNDGGFRTEPGEHLVAFDYLNSGAAFGDDETGNLPTRQGWSVIGADTMTHDDPLLPLGLDSHRYRCCGNGVVAPVAEWLGARLMAALS